MQRATRNVVADVVVGGVVVGNAKRPDIAVDCSFVWTSVEAAVKRTMPLSVSVAPARMVPALPPAAHSQPPSAAAALPSPPFRVPAYSIAVAVAHFDVVAAAGIAVAVADGVDGHLRGFGVDVPPVRHRSARVKPSQ